MTLREEAEKRLADGHKFTTMSAEQQLPRMGPCELLNVNAEGARNYRVHTKGLLNWLKKQESV